MVRTEDRGILIAKAKKRHYLSICRVGFPSVRVQLGQCVQKDRVDTDSPQK